MDLASLKAATHEIDDLRPKVYVHPDDYDNLIALLPEDMAGRIQIFESKWLTRSGEALVVDPAEDWTRLHYPFQES